MADIVFLSHTCTYIIIIIIIDLLYVYACGWCVSMAKLDRFRHPAAENIVFNTFNDTSIILVLLDTGIEPDNVNCSL